jgi:thiamine kinase-like enzyme
MHLYKITVITIITGYGRIKVPIFDLSMLTRFYSYSSNAMSLTVYQYQYHTLTMLIQSFSLVYHTSLDQLSICCYSPSHWFIIRPWTTLDQLSICCYSPSHWFIIRPWTTLDQLSICCYYSSKNQVKEQKNELCCRSSLCLTIKGNLGRSILCQVHC